MDNLTRVALSATRRTRATYLVLMFTTMLVFIAMYNRSIASWSESSIRAVRNAQAIFPCAMNWRKQQLNGPNGGQSNPEADAELEATSIAQTCLADPKVINIGLSIEALTNAARYLSARDYLRHGDGDILLANDLNTWETFQRENVYTVPIPFVGMRMEGDALGVVSGLTFFALLFLLFLCLDRERQNLSLISNDPSSLKTLEAFQIFTRTTAAKSADLENKLISFTVFLPVLLHGFSTFLAIKNRKLGFMLSTTASWRLLVAEPILFFMTLLAARRCWKVMRMIAKHWSMVHHEGHDELHAQRAKRTA